MQVNLAYGKNGLLVDLPGTARLFESRPVTGLADEPAAIRDALCRPIESPPLRELVRPGDRVVVVHSDLTRPMPNDRALPVLLEELEAAGVGRDDITLLNGLGTHRPQTQAELEEMLGAQIVANYRCLQHDAGDLAQLELVGVNSFGHPVYVNRTYLEADFRILTGFIEPHLFAGFSGGPKAVFPSIAGLESILANHGAEMVGHPNATWGVTHGNPVWQEMLEVALAAGPAFLLNVTLNKARQITGVFAGDLQAAHAAGCAFCARSAIVPIPHLYDIAITTNSGYPLDLNLYQSVKGMSAAARAIRPGGAIILAAECSDGLPEHGEYANLLRAAASPQAMLERVNAPGVRCMDQWEVQVQAQVQLKAEVHLYSDGLSDLQIRQALLRPCRSVEHTLAELMERYGPAASVCVFTEGPQTIPVLEV